MENPLISSIHRRPRPAPSKAGYTDSGDSDFDDYGSGGANTKIIRQRLERGESLDQKSNPVTKILRQWGYGLELYNWRLTGPHPLKLEASITDARQGSKKAAHALIDVILTGKNAQGSGYAKDPENAKGPERGERPEHRAEKYWAGKIDGFSPDHHFGFLIDLGRLENQPSAKKVAYLLTTKWCDKFITWHKSAWRPEILSMRLLNWLSHVGLVFGSDDLVYRSRVLLAAARQVRHLPRVFEDITSPIEKIHAASALCLAGLLLPNSLILAERNILVLASLTAELILPDGTPATRYVPHAIQILTSLLLVRRAVKARHLKLFDPLENILDRLNAFLGALKLRDQKFASLLGASPGDNDPLDSLIDDFDAGISSARSHEATSFPEGGIHRLSCGGNIVLLDTGPSPRGMDSKQVAASTGALEFASGRERLLVQVGPNKQAGLESLWRTTAAHSAPVLDNRNVTEIIPNGTLGKGVTYTRVTRKSLQQTEQISLTHDGYEKRLGYTLSRIIRLTRDGLILSGEEKAIAVHRQAQNVSFDCRFHLHPDLSVQQARDGEIVIITASRKIWLFEAGGADILLEESLYCPNRHTARQNSVIVLRQPSLSGGNKFPADSVPITWSLTRKE